MLANRTNDFLRLLRMMSGEPAAEDAVLLARFAAERDEAAFAELVRRHGPLVLGVCQRVAGHAQDAEDAFQAVFLVLARKAGTLAQPERLPAFLYGVAYRIAKRARRSAGRRRNRELKAANRPEPISFPAADNADLWPALDREVTALPDWCRQAVILCDFDGVSRTDAARRLGIPEGTLSSRLNTGRKKLAARLAARGVTLSVLPVISPELTAAAVPASLLELTLAAALNGAAGTSVAALAFYGSGPMRWKLLTLLAALATGATTAGMIWAMQSPPEAKTTPKLAPEVAKVPDEKGAMLPGKAVLADFKDYPGMPVHIEWAPSGSQFAITLMKNRGSDYSTAQLQVLSNHHLKLTWHLPEEKNLYSLGYSKDGTRLLYVKREQGLVSSQPLWKEFSVKDNTEIVSRPIDETDLRGGVLSPDGQSIVLTYEPEDANIDEGGIQFFEIASGTLGPVKYRVPSRIFEFVFSADGRRWATVNGSNKRRTTTLPPSVTMWDTDGKQLWTIKPEKPKSPELERESFRQIYISADGALVALKLKNHPLKILDGQDGHEGPEMERKEDVVNLYGLSSNGRLLAGMVADIKKEGNFIRGNGGLRPIDVALKLVIWDTSSGKILKTWDVSNSSNGSVQLTLKAKFAPSQPLLVIAERDTRDKDNPNARVGLWDLSSLVK